MRHQPGKHNQASHGKGGAGKNTIVKGTDQTEWAADLTRDGYAKNELDGGYRAWAGGDLQLAAIGKKQGFDGKPTKGSIEDTVRAGGTELHRGVMPHNKTKKSAESIVDDFKNGPYEPGSGVYGNGYYFSNKSRVANHYAKGGKTFRAALKPEAKVISDEDLKTQMKNWQEQVKPKTQSVEELYKADFKTPKDQYSPRMVQEVMADPGRFAAMKGYDAIKVTGKQDGAPVLKGEPKAKHPESGKFFSANDQYIVLNRTAIVVEEA